MYENHPSLTEPEEDTVIWRYLDIAKFIHLLNSSSLFFTRLTRFSDPYEGHMTKGTLNELLKIPKSFPKDEREEREKTIRQNVNFFTNMRPMLCASCWHENKTESAAMWNLYIGSGQGLAIRTTFAKLKKAFKPSKITVSAGMVKYVDYDTHNLNPTNIFNFGILKRNSFEHERELRALIMDDTDSAGIYVDINLSELIENIVISPNSPSWFIDVITNQMKIHKLEEKIIKSSLMEHPEYLKNFFQSSYGSNQS